MTASIIHTGQMLLGTHLGSDSISHVEIQLKSKGWRVLPAYVQH